MRSLSKLSRSAAALACVAFVHAALAQLPRPTPAQPNRFVNAVPHIASANPSINTVAGNGNGGYLGSGVPALQAELSQPSAVAFDSAGNLYLADTDNQRIRKVSTAGIITTYAGNGSQGYAGDGDQADSASLNTPSAIAFDSTGNLYIADSGNNVIRKVTPAGVISTVAGNAAMGPGFSGDTAAATAAQLYAPNGVAVDAKGNLYIADTDNCVVRIVNTKGIISTYAGVAPPSNKNWDGPCRYFGANGNGVVNGGYNGDGPATAAQLNRPQGLAVDAKGDLYIADTANSLIRVVSPTAALTTVAGSFPSGYTGDNGPALAAALSNPESVALDSSGNLYIADSYNSVVREVTASTGYIATIAGNGTAGFSGDTGPATSAELDNPGGVALDSFGDIFIADTANNRIREVGALAPTAAQPIFSQPSGTYAAPLEITLSDSTAGASIFYTTNGTTPGTAAGNGTSLYAGKAIPVDALGATTIQAIATAKGMSPSAVVSVTYTLVQETAQPKITPATGVYSAAQTVQISDITSGAAIHYTLDGSVPTASSPVYTTPFIVSGDLTVQAIAIAAGQAQSPLAWSDYVFVGTPTVLPYPATAIKTPAATLNAVVNTLGVSGSYYFLYGTSSTALTVKTAPKSLSASASSVLATQTVTGLVSKTTYYYQVVVTTKAGVATSAILSFTAN